jgi:hypothetical protein
MRAREIITMTGPSQRFSSRVNYEAAIIPCGFGLPCGIGRNLQIQVEPGRLRFGRREWFGREHDSRQQFFRASELVEITAAVVRKAIPGVFV